MYTKCCLGEKLNIPEFESLINSCEYYELEFVKQKGKVQKHYKKWYNVNEQEIVENEVIADEFTHNYIVNMMTSM